MDDLSSIDDGPIGMQSSPAADVLGVKGPLRIRPHGTTQKAHIVLRRVEPSEDSDDEDGVQTRVCFSFFARKRIEVKPGKEILFAIASPDAKVEEQAVMFTADILEAFEDSFELEELPDEPLDDQPPSKKWKKNWGKPTDDLYVPVQPVIADLPSQPQYATVAIQTEQARVSASAQTDPPPEPPKRSSASIQAEPVAVSSGVQTTPVFPPPRVSMTTQTDAPPLFESISVQTDPDKDIAARWAALKAILADAQGISEDAEDAPKNADEGPGGVADALDTQLSDMDEGSDMALDSPSQTTTPNSPILQAAPADLSATTMESVPPLSRGSSRTSVLNPSSPSVHAADLVSVGASTNDLDEKFDEVPGLTAGKGYDLTQTSSRIENASKPWGVRAQEKPVSISEPLVKVNAVETSASSVASGKSPLKSKYLTAPSFVPAKTTVDKPVIVDTTAPSQAEDVSTKLSAPSAAPLEKVDPPVSNIVDKQAMEKTSSKAVEISLEGRNRDVTGAASGKLPAPAPAATPSIKAESGSRMPPCTQSSETLSSSSAILPCKPAPAVKLEHNRSELSRSISSTCPRDPCRRKEDLYSPLEDSRRHGDYSDTYSEESEYEYERRKRKPHRLPSDSSRRERERPLRRWERSDDDDSDPTHWEPSKPWEPPKHPPLPLAPESSYKSGRRGGRRRSRRDRDAEVSRYASRSEQGRDRGWDSRGEHDDIRSSRSRSPPAKRVESLKRMRSNSPSALEKMFPKGHIQATTGPSKRSESPRPADDAANKTKQSHAKPSRRSESPSAMDELFQRSKRPNVQTTPVLPQAAVAAQKTVTPPNTATELLPAREQQQSLPLPDSPTSRRLASPSIAPDRAQTPPSPPRVLAHSRLQTPPRKERPAPPPETPPSLPPSAGFVPLPPASPVTKSRFSAPATAPAPLPVKRDAGPPAWPKAMNTVSAVPPPGPRALAMMSTSNGSFSNPLNILPSAAGTTSPNAAARKPAPPVVATPNGPKKRVVIGSGWAPTRQGQSALPAAAASPTTTSESKKQAATEASKGSMAGYTTSSRNSTAASEPSADTEDSLIVGDVKSPAADVNASSPLKNLEGLAQSADAIDLHIAKAVNQSPAASSAQRKASIWPLAPPIVHPLPPRPTEVPYALKRGQRPDISPRPLKRAHQWTALDELHKARVASDVPVEVLNVRFSSDGAFLAVTCNDMSVRIWNNGARLETAKLSHNSVVVATVWMDGDSGIVTLCRDGVVNKWTRSGQNKWQWAKLLDAGYERASDDDALSLAYARDRVAISLPRVVKVWLWVKGTWQAQRDIMRKDVTSVQFVEEGKALLGGTKDGMLWYHALGGNLQVYQFLRTRISSIEIDKTGDYALVTHDAARCASLVGIYQNDTKGKVMHVFKNRDAATAAFGAVFACDGGLVLFGSSEGATLLRDAQKGAPMYGLDHGQGQVQAAAIFDRGADGSCIVTGTKNGQLYWWPQPTPQ